MNDLDWKMIESGLDATLLTVGLVAETLIRSAKLDREEFIAALHQIAANRRASHDDDLVREFAALTVEKLAKNLEEGLTFFPTIASKGDGL